MIFARLNFSWISRGQIREFINLVKIIIIIELLKINKKLWILNFVKSFKIRNSRKFKHAKVTRSIVAKCKYERGKLGVCVCRVSATTCMSVCFVVSLFDGVWTPQVCDSVICRNVSRGWGRLVFDTSDSDASSLECQASHILVFYIYIFNQTLFSQNSGSAPVMFLLFWFGLIWFDSHSTSFPAYWRVSLC